jgi:aspartate/methionine/tyrosine aminotransferase
MKSNIDSGMFRPLQVAAVAALRNTPELHHAKNITVYAKRRVIAERIMQTLNCSFDPKQVGMFLWGRIPDHYADAGVLADEVLYHANVFITPGFIFGNQGKHYIRISLCSPKEKLEEAFERIEKMKQEIQNNHH